MNQQHHYLRVITSVQKCNYLFLKCERRQVVSSLLWNCERQGGGRRGGAVAVALRVATLCRKPLLADAFSQWADSEAAALVLQRVSTVALQWLPRRQVPGSTLRSILIVWRNVLNIDFIKAKHAYFFTSNPLLVCLSYFHIWFYIEKCAQNHNTICRQNLPNC
jgi:hypothetical protein